MPPYTSTTNGRPQTRLIRALQIVANLGQPRLAGLEPGREVGGADVIRQAPQAGWVDEFILTIAPITLGAGKRLFDGFEESLDLQPIGVWQSPYATHISYRVKPS